MASANLFGWRELQAAEQAVAQAHAVQETARRKALYAPHGCKREREKALIEATAAALRAEAELAALNQELGHEELGL